MQSWITPENLPVVLSLIVALVAAIGPIISSAIQAYSTKKAKTKELYFAAQLKAYSELLESLVPETLDTPEGRYSALREAVTALQPALLLSRPKAAKMIRRYYLTYCDYIDEWAASKRTPITVERRREELWQLQDCLRDEMFRFELWRNRQIHVADSRYQQQASEANKRHNNKRKVKKAQNCNEDTQPVNVEGDL